MNIPNSFTVLRIILVPVMIICLIQDLYVKAFVIFVIASVTDALDGFLARVLKQKTILGSYLDPLADKALIASSFVTLSIMTVIPSWLTVIVISRDLVILIGICILSLMSVPYAIKPAFVSKITTTFQFMTVLFALASKASPIQFNPDFIHAFSWITALFTVISGFTYIVRGIGFINHSD